MWRVIYGIVFTLAVIEATLKTKSIKVVGGDEVDLGSYDAKVYIGTFPSLYNLTTEDERVSAKASQTLEQLRKSFTTGILSIPPLDPYKSHNLRLITLPDTSLVTGKIEIHEVLLQGGKSFNLKSLQIRMKNDLRADFDVNIPSLHGHVLIHADLMLGSILPMKVKGKVKFNIKDINMKGAVGAVETTLDGKEVYQLQNWHTDIHADKIHVTLKGFGKSWIHNALRFLRESNFKNASINKSTSNLTGNYVAKIAIKEVNKILNGFSVHQIKAFLENPISL